jgi:anthranilate synthase component 2
VYRNDEFNIDEIAEFDKILLSPGPGVPEEAGLLKDIIRKYGATKAYLAFALDSKQLAKSMEEHYLILRYTVLLATMVKTVVDDELLRRSRKRI